MRLIGWSAICVSTCRKYACGSMPLSLADPRRLYIQRRVRRRHRSRRINSFFSTKPLRVTRVTLRCYRSRFSRRHDIGSVLSSATSRSGLRPGARTDPSILSLASSRNGPTDFPSQNEVAGLIEFRSKAFCEVSIGQNPASSMRLANHRRRRDPITCWRAAGRCCQNAIGSA
jgi:hypothetical protein